MSNTKLISIFTIKYNFAVKKTKFSEDGITFINAPDVNILIMIIISILYTI